MVLLLKYWKPAAVLLLLLLLSNCCYQKGAEHERAKWELLTARQTAAAAIASQRSTEAARKQEADWAAAFDAAATISNEELTHVQAHRDRLLSQLRTVRVPVIPAGSGVPEAPADSGQPQTAPESGQPGLAGEELVGRLATCDEVTLERNQAVRLLEAERGK